MNEVGRGADGLGKGESVWMGMFQIDAFSKFADIAEKRGDKEHAKSWRNHVSKLGKALDEHAWDGQWYKRAWYHDGTSLGSIKNKECQIDLLPQTWATWAFNNTPERKARAEKAMKSVNKRLFNREGKLIHLFTPPFKDSNPTPGYIQGYVAGTRENGGQYTHAANWAIKAFSHLAKANSDNQDKAANYAELAHEAFSAINPINHARNQNEVNIYKTEPYVVAADVYGVEPHVGRGGWSWYTGSAGWLYRVGTESILGLNKVDGNKLSVDPCIPKEWNGFEIDYKNNTTDYHITVENPDHVSVGVKKVVDNPDENNPVEFSDKIIPLKEDRKKHNIKVIMG